MDAAPGAEHLSAGGTGLVAPDDTVLERETSVARFLNDPRSVTLVSTMKSGTHWLRYLFANYVRIMSSDVPKETEPVKYEALQHRYSPTDRRLAFSDASKFKVSKDCPFHGISNFMWQHVDRNLLDYPGQVVFVHRNPLDYLISRYHYDKDLWEKEGRDVSSPEATIPWSIRWYVENLALMRDVARQRPIISVSYEDLKANTFVAMSIVWRSLGVPVNRHKLARAIDYSSADRVRQEEEARGRPIVGSTTTGRFVRDSSVGQWKGQISEQGIRQIDKILREHNFNLAQFVVDFDENPELSG